MINRLINLINLNIDYSPRELLGDWDPHAYLSFEFHCYDGHAYFDIGHKYLEFFLYTGHFWKNQMETSVFPQSQQLKRRMFSACRM